jgi:membrane-associated phospholipid phosphatase
MDTRMEQLLGLQTWGTDLILWLQQFSSAPLDAFFKAVTWLGTPPAYLVILTLLYWCVDKRWGIRLLVLAMLSSWVNEVIKSLLRLPRPDPTRVRQLVTEPTYGLPSNHAQTGGVIIWGYLAAKIRKGWFTAIAVVMALLIGLSRPYLGIHFPQDVLVGWLLGIVILAIWLHLEDRLVAWWQRQSTSRQVIVSVLGPLALLLLMPPDKLGHYPNEAGGTFSGMLLGAGLGSILESHAVHFRADGVWWRRLLRYLLGLVLVGAIYAAGSSIPELNPWALDVAVRLARYALLAFIAIGIAPWLFVKLHLADSDEPA